MVRLAKRPELFPEEPCAQAGKQGNEGTLMKILYTDIHRTMHVAHAVISADLKNAYNSIQSTVASMSMRYVGVPQQIAELMLLALCNDVC